MSDQQIKELLNQTPTIADDYGKFDPFGGARKIGKAFSFLETLPFVSKIEDIADDLGFGGIDALKDTADLIEEVGEAVGAYDKDDNAVANLNGEGHSSSQGIAPTIDQGHGATSPAFHGSGGISVDLSKATVATS